MYGGHNVVKAFNGEEASVKQFNEFNDSLYESAWKSQFFSGLMQPITMFIGNVGYVAVCLLGGVLAGGGNITIGDIQAYHVSCKTIPNNERKSLRPKSRISIPSI